MKKQKTKDRRKAFRTVLVTWGILMMAGSGSGNLFPETHACCICHAAEAEDPEQRVTDPGEIIGKTNEKRIECGLEPLKADENLTEGAMLRAWEQTELFSHERPDGRWFSTVCEPYMESFTCLGENLGWSVCGNHDGILDAWMQSCPHRDMILNGRFTRIGVGYVEKDGLGYWCQLFSDEI